MRELGFKRVLFLVHRNQIAKQAKASFERVFGSRIKTGLVSGIKHDYDEAHHTSAGSYKRVMDYFTPEFTLGMTATPDKRDDKIEGR